MRLSSDSEPAARDAMKLFGTVQARAGAARPLSEKLRKVIDQRVSSMAAMLCSHS